MKDYFAALGVLVLLRSATTVSIMMFAGNYCYMGWHCISYELVDVLVLLFVIQQCG